MAKSITKVKAVSTVPKIKKILISQPRPESEKSPYFELERKHNIQLHFAPFIQLVPIVSKEFRKQKIDVTTYTGVIFTSKNANVRFSFFAKYIKIIYGL